MIKIHYFFQQTLCQYIWAQGVATEVHGVQAEVHCSPQAERAPQNASFFRVSFWFTEKKADWSRSSKIIVWKGTLKESNGTTTSSLSPPPLLLGEHNHCVFVLIFVENTCYFTRKLNKFREQNGLKLLSRGEKIVNIFWRRTRSPIEALYSKFAPERPRYGPVCALKKHNPLLTTLKLSPTNATEGFRHMIEYLPLNFACIEKAQFSDSLLFE